jgi:predicted nuclease with TOPRIM domain
MFSLLSGFITPTVIKWGVIISAVLGVYFYIGHLQSSNEILRQNNAKLEASNQAQQETIKKIQEDHAAIIKAKDTLAEKLDELKKERTELVDQLDRESKKKKSIEELARKKSKLVEKAINNGTAEALKCFETLSVDGKCE